MCATRWPKRVARIARGVVAESISVVNLRVAFPPVRNLDGTILAISSPVLTGVPRNGKEATDA